MSPIHKIRRKFSRVKLFSNIVKTIWKVEKSILWFFPKEVAHKVFYKRLTGENLNLIQPKNFNEKIQWLIVNKYGSELSPFVDKYLVRDYVKNKGYKKHLPKLLGVYKNTESIDISKLPNKFVLKANHGAGYDFHSICTSKKDYDYKSEFKKLSKSLKKNYAKVSLEYHYSYITPRIICEEYLEDEQQTPLLDYKLFCFHGKVKCILVCSERNGTNFTRDYYDREWNYLDYTKEEYRHKNGHEKPKNLKKMFDIAEDLAESFSFVRVDFYNIEGDIYFGEMTFSPAAGKNMTYNDYGLKKLGEYLSI